MGIKCNTHIQTQAVYINPKALLYGLWTILNKRSVSKLILDAFRGRVGDCSCTLITFILKKGNRTSDYQSNGSPPKYILVRGLWEDYWREKRGLVSIKSAFTLIMGNITSNFKSNDPP